MSNTEELLKQANELKDLGNKYFTETKYHQAIEYYTKAIEKLGAHPQLAIYYSNRSMCNIRLELFGQAIEDGLKGIEADKTFIKNYYRIGCSYFAMRKLKESLVWFKKIKTELNINNQDTNEKIKILQSLIKEEKFFESIKKEDEIDLILSQKIIPSEKYTGPTYEEGEVLTIEKVKEFLQYMKEEKYIDKSYLFAILKDAQKVIIKEDNINDITVEEHNEITVCGDIHGQYYDLLNIFEINGYPTAERPYLFNGDFVDRGSFGVECVIALLLFKLYNPKCMFLNRGNHEDEGLNKLYGFEGEVLAKYCGKTFRLFLYLFNSLPLAQVINKKVFVVHGGIPRGENFKLEDMKKVNRMSKIPESGDFCDMLWADPTREPGVQNSKRGVSYQFGPDIAERFLANNNLELIVRSHEVREEGYDIEPNNKVITIFSAPKYCDQMTNKGAFIIFKGSEMKPLFKQFEAVPHPPKMAMHYAKQASSMFR